MAGKSGFDINPYETLGLDKKCTETEIVKAFRKAALKWHPDKNLDRKDLAEQMFLKISRAFELLTDAAARAAYDRLEATKSARAVYVKRREQTESENRRRFREELERREADAASNAAEEAERAKMNLQKEIERLRKEGSKLLQRERENIEREVHRKAKMPTSEQPSTTSNDDSHLSARLKVKWKRKDGNYDEGKLRSIFAKYGEVSEVVISVGGKGSAIVEFRNARDALKAEGETGDIENPLRISWITPKADVEAMDDSAADTSRDASEPAKTDRAPPNIAPQGMFRSSTQFADFEAEVLAQMMSGTKRRAECVTSKFDDL